MRDRITLSAKILKPTLLPTTLNANSAWDVSASDVEYKSYGEYMRT